MKNTQTYEKASSRQPVKSALILEQANGQTTIYDGKLNVLFRVDGRYFDQLNPIVESINYYEAQYERDSELRTHAEALAEELRQVLKHGSAGNENHIREALARWDEASQR